MKLKWQLAVLLALMMALIALPVTAAETAQGSGGIHFGPYTLASGNYVSKDLVVFGGPVLIKDGAVFDSDLTVFGPATVEAGARVDGQLVVFGTLDVQGTVDGSVFCAGTVSLGDTAYISGDLDSAGTIDRDEDAVVAGEITTVDEGEFNWNLPFGAPGTQPIKPAAGSTSTPLWIRWITGLFRAMAGVVIMTLVALLIASIWPEQMQRISMTIEDAPLPAFGVGLLTLIVSGLAMLLLLITICLALFSVVGMILVGIGLLVGMVALGNIIGRRFMRAVAPLAKANTVVEALIGTALLSLLLAVAQVFGPLRVLMLFVLLPVAAGAVVLTRFGTRPYMARSGSTGVVMPDSRAAAAVPAVFAAPEPEPVSPVGQVPPPLPEIEDGDEDVDTSES